MNALAPRPETETETLAALIRTGCDPDGRGVVAAVTVYDADGSVVGLFDVPLAVTSASARRPAPTPPSVASAR